MMGHTALSTGPQQQGARIASPSPTKNWSSGFERILLVSIMGGICPAPRAALYAAWVGYRGGGGRTLRAVISERVVIAVAWMIFENQGQDETDSFSQHDG